VAVVVVVVVVVGMARTFATISDPISGTSEHVEGRFERKLFRSCELSFN